MGSMSIPVPNIFPATTGPASSEEFLTLLENGQIKIERILSHGQASAKDFWYDQPNDEWVLLLQGEAVLEFEGVGMTALVTGSYLHMQRHLRHRVEATSQDAVWLAIHFLG